MKTTLKFFTYWCMVLVLVITSCSDDNDPVVADSIDLVTGVNQAGIIETVLPEPVEVIVKDQNGKGFVGAIVNFSVAEGSVSSAQVTTDAAGKAAIIWTLGATVGKQVLTVSAFKADGTPLRGSPFTVSATATPVPVFAETITLHSGGGQSAIVETALTNPVEVVVKNQNGDVFEGTVVNFSVAEGSVSSATATTNASGIATVSWTLGASEGTQLLTVTALKADGMTPLTGSPISVVATATPKPIAIGDFYQGGVVFYVDETGVHGLVCLVSELSGLEKVAWGCKGILVGADGSAIGTGAQNTVIMESECDEGETAAWVCTHFSYGIDEDHYDDYFLPSDGELYLMWQNKDIINPVAISKGGNAFVNGRYWSSTEESSNVARAIGFDNTGWAYDEKDIANYVRPVRAF